MKKLFLFLGLGLFSLANLVAQTNAQTQNQAPTVAPVKVENKNAPEITMDKTIYDFGTIAFASNGSFEFGFKNTGKEPLIISNVVKQCGCTNVDWPKEPIKSGAKGVIKVTYDTKRVGPFTKTITVFSNAKTEQVPLTFKGTVEAAPEEPATTTSK